MHCTVLNFDSLCLSYYTYDTSTRLVPKEAMVRMKEYTWKGILKMTKLFVNDNKILISFVILKIKLIDSYARQSISHL